MTDEYDIEVYATADGREPFQDWLSSIKDKRAQGSVLLRLQRIRQGNFGDCKHFDGIHELRIHYGPGLRIYFAKIGSKVVLLLGGGDKSTQDKDIKCCKIFLEDHKKAKI